MTTGISKINTDALGAEVVGPAYEVTAEEIVAFAKATNDEAPESLAGRIAPPVYALNPVLWTMVGAKKQVIPDFGFHGEQDIVFHRHIVPGMHITPTARVIGIHGRSTGVAITVKVDSRDQHSSLINEQYFVSFVSKATVAASKGDVALPHDLNVGDKSNAPLHSVTYPMNPNQTQRYADASHDHDAYTLDEAVARSMGFPAILVHGMCTLAFSGRAIVENLCGRSPARLRRLAVRLSRPVFLFPDQCITTTIWRKRDQSKAYGFDARDKAGDVVLTNGLAEVSS